MKDRHKKCMQWFKDKYPDVKIKDESNVEIIYPTNKPENPQAPYELTDEQQQDMERCPSCGSLDCMISSYEIDEYSCKLVREEEKEIIKVLGKIINKYY
tara:strand:- start:200 stop:496 length:297 start_codon:yes stop_codon:yes gene_type:complete